MVELLGKPVADAICANLKDSIEELKGKNKIPTLAIVRVGNREDDISYERGARKRFADNNCDTRVVELSADVDQDELEKTIVELNNDSSVNGILLFRPLPKQLSEARIQKLIEGDKDVDCMGLENMARLFAGSKEGFAPCTAQAVIELLHHYDIELKGKKVTVIGRSLVIGKPVAMMLIKENATVTVCHTKTEDLIGECKNADIIVAAAGVAKMVSAEYVKPSSIVIDVGMNVDEAGKLCGDVDFAGISEIVDRITPVPRGVGSVTTSVLLKNTVANAIKSTK